MSFRWQVAFWVTALALVMAALWLLQQILLPFVAGMALAYLFDPFARRLERLGVRRFVAALFVLALFLLGFVVLILLIVPVLGEQLWAFIAKLPGYIGKLHGILTDPSHPWVRKLLGEGFSDPNATIGDLVQQGVGWLTTFLRSLWSGGQALVSLFSLVVVTPVVAFYLLCDWDRVLTTVDSWIPVHHRETVRDLGREIDSVIAGFVRGQTVVCLVLGAFYALALTLVGLNFGLLIGLVSGLVSFVPYLGSMTGLVLSTGVAVAQFWPDWTSILIVLGIFFVGQFIEGYILSPKLVGESVRLHPVWVMFAIFAFGYLFGFVGLLLAVPVAAAIGVLVRFGLRQYLASPLYTGEPEVPSSPSAPKKRARP